MDAPETSQGTSGKWSTQSLKELIQGKERYGRTVAEIFVGIRSISLQMVQVGAAYAYRQHLKQHDRDSHLNAAEDAASKKGLGIWSPYKPDQVPWECRRSRRR